jgi:hypothetical protein
MFTIVEVVFKWYIIPRANLLWIQVEDNRQRIKLVQTWSYVPVLNVGQTADVDNELWLTI